MDIFILKLILAPIILGGASLAGRRWGPTVSGWLIGLPLTSGPVAFFVAISHSESFAASTVLGTLSGGLPLVAFCLGYGWLAVSFPWPVAILGSLLAYGALTVLMQNVTLPLAVIFPLVVMVIFAGLWFMPKTSRLATTDAKPGKWDLPARILLGTSFILIITGIAPFIGPRLTGLLSTIPLYTAILTIFSHRLQGAAGAASVLRGLLYGLFGFAGFYLVLTLLLGNVSLGLAFGAALLTTLAIQGVTLVFMRRAHVPAAGD